MGYGTDRAEEEGMSLEAGALVGVPATYTKGPFGDEMLVSIDTGAEKISGFVKRDNIRFIDDTNALVRAKVLSIEPEIMLELFGQFFTTNGVEPVQADWAQRNLKDLAAA
jgi:hypothetical protein